jgi:methylisocitrate lyase
MPDVSLLANMTEFGKTPFFTAADFEAMGYAMVIWPVSALWTERLQGA